MPYPSKYTRLANFTRDASNGLPSPEPMKVDAELNNIQTSLEQTNLALRGITTADGRLRNVAQAIAASLAATWSGTGDGTAVLTTTIPWDSDYSVNTLLVMVGGVLQRPNQILSVTNGGGFVVVTLTGVVALGAAVVVWAFEPGAGILTTLASTLEGNGASLIGVEDAFGLLASATVEDALMEIAGNLETLTTALGDLAAYFKSDGSVVAIGNFDMGGFKIGNAADGSELGDYVTVRQIANYIAAWTDLSRFYMKRDGTTAMAGDLNFGNNKGINLADPDLNSPLDAVNVRSMLRSIATNGAAPVGTVTNYVGSVPPDNWLLCDGQVYKADAYPVLSALLAASYRTGSAQGCAVAAFPSLVAGATPGDVSGGALVLGDITSLLTSAGQGYTGAPKIRCVNPNGTDAPGQPGFTVTVSAVVVDGASVTGGAITSVVITTGGSGILAGASLVVDNVLAASPSQPALYELPAGYFRTPDLRGRVTIGAGTESKSPGVIDPPSVAKGDTYNATPRDVGDYGGEEQHRLTTAELPAHTHANPSTDTRYSRTTGSGDGGQGSSGGFEDKYLQSVGSDAAHNNVPPFHVLTVIIKAQ